MYDVTQKDTFANLETWLNEADQFSTGVGKEAVKLLVGNKVDLPRVVERSEAEAWAKERNMLFIEASAKTTEGITQVFNEAVQKVCRLIFEDDDDDNDDRIMKGKGMVMIMIIMRVREMRIIIIMISMVMMMLWTMMFYLKYHHSSCFFHLNNVIYMVLS